MKIGMTTAGRPLRRGGRAGRPVMEEWTGGVDADVGSSSVGGMRIGSLLRMVGGKGGGYPAWRTAGMTPNGGKRLGELRIVTVALKKYRDFGWRKKVVRNWGRGG